MDFFTHIVAEMLIKLVKSGNYWYDDDWYSMEVVGRTENVRSATAGE